VPRSHREIEFPLSPAAGRVPATGFFRPGKRIRNRPRQQGRLVIRALVHARLFGLKLLTLDACVVVDDEDTFAPVVPAPPSTTSSYARTRTRYPWSGPASPRPGPETSLPHAVQLLEQSVYTLEQSRRLRLSCDELSLLRHGVIAHGAERNPGYLPDLEVRNPLGVWGEIVAVEDGGFIRAGHSAIGVRRGLTQALVNPRAIVRPTDGFGSSRPGSGCVVLFSGSYGVGAGGRGVTSSERAFCPCPCRCLRGSRFA